MALDKTTSGESPFREKHPAGPAQCPVSLGKEAPFRHHGVVVLDDTTALLWESPLVGSSLVSVLLGSEKQCDPRQAILDRLVRGSSLRSVRVQLRLNAQVVAKVLGIGTRTINRKEKTGEQLTVAEADRAYRLARTADLAIDLIGDREKALTWLQTPNAHFRGNTPVEMLETEIGTEAVTQSLYAIAYGGVA